MKTRTSDSRNYKVAVFGATSAIVQGVARLMAERGSEFFLVARDEAKLTAVASDLRARGAQSVHTVAEDLNDFSRHATLVAQASEALGRLEIVIIAHGILGMQAEAAESFHHAQEIFTTNTLSPVSLLIALTPEMSKQGFGTIVALGSVAGDRGRLSNYTYAASKAALSVYLQGLRAKMFKKGVSVVELKPGPVETPMTKDLKRGALFTTPARIAPAILRAIESRRAVAYVPGYWRLIMFVIRHLPEALNKRLSY